MPKNCPRCQSALELVLNEDVKVHTCQQCRGVWVDYVDEKKALQMKPLVFTKNDFYNFRRLYQGSTKPDPVKYVPCPVCRTLMNRSIWGAGSGVIVDKCRDHGTWYDAGELEKIRDYVAFGGVEFDKMKLTAQQIDELHTKVEKEVTRLDIKIDSAYRKARLWSLLGF